MGKAAFKRCQDAARRENEGIERDREHQITVNNDERRRQMKKQREEAKRTLANMNAGVFMNAKFAFTLNERGQIAGLDNDFVAIKVMSPNDPNRAEPMYVMVNDTRGHVVGAARDIKDPARPTAEELWKFVAAMRKPAHVTVRTDGRHDYVNIAYPRGPSSGKFSVTYYQTAKEVPEPPARENGLLWGCESVGNGVTQMLFVRTRVEVMVDGTRPPKPEMPVNDVATTPAVTAAEATEPTSDEEYPDNQTT